MQSSNSFTEYDIHELCHDLKCHETIILVVLTTMEQGTSKGQVTDESEFDNSF